MDERDKQIIEQVRIYLKQTGRKRTLFLMVFCLLLAIGSTAAAIFTIQFFSGHLFTEQPNIVWMGFGVGTAMAFMFGFLTFSFGNLAIIYFSNFRGSQRDKLLVEMYDQLYGPSENEAQK